MLSYIIRSILTIQILIILIIPLESKSQECAKVKITDFPGKDLPPGFDHSHLKQPESYKYYYGIGVPVDYVKARHFAFIEMKADTDWEGKFQGPSILMMLYANGFGVQRNLDISIRLACANVGGAPAEIDGRIQHLKKIKAEGSKGIFDICDDITSGYMMGMCQSIHSEITGINRKSKTDSVVKNWLQKDRFAYEKIRKAASDFFEERTANEVDMSGTARAMLVLEESDNLEDNFLREILKSGKCGSIKYSSRDFLKADKELNLLYSKIMNNKTAEWGTVTREGIKSTQKKWIRYRDAWVIFGAERCPKMPAAAWKTLITKERTRQLKDFSDE